MEQKSNSSNSRKSRRKDSSSSNNIASTSSNQQKQHSRRKSTLKQESTIINKPTTRSEKRKFEQEQKELQQKTQQTQQKKQKTNKMDISSSSKGKQKEAALVVQAEEHKPSLLTTAADTNTKKQQDEEMQEITPQDDFDLYNNDEQEVEEEEEEEDWGNEPKEDTSSDHSDIQHEEEEEEEDQEDEHQEDEDEEGQGEQDNEEEEEDDDDEDVEDVDDELSRVRRTLGLQMQGLFGGIISSGGSDSNRFRSILTSLKNNDDPTMQLVALQELAEILSVSSEDNLAGYFSSDSFCKELVRIMKGSDDLSSMVVTDGDDMDQDMMLALAMSEGLSGGNPEIMLLACRCISNLLEAMPTAVTSVVFHGAIRVLCDKLKSIQYIDLAEQALYALEKIAAQLPRAVVHEGGISAALMYFDFFSIHAQRTALRTAANCMRGIDQDSFTQVLEITPTLMNTITYSDRTVVELTCLCWVRISEFYRGNRENLERAITTDLLKILYGLIPISGNANAVHPATFGDLLRIFRSISKASPQLSFELLKMGIIDSFYQILTGATSIPNAEKPPPLHVTLDTKWRDSVPHIMKIIVDLLPPLPKDDMFSTRRFKESRTSRSSPGNEAPASAATTVDPRTTWFQEHPQVLFKLDIILIPLILDMYASTVNLRVRQLVTHTLVKLVHYSDTETLSKVLKNVSLSSFLSGILTRQEHPSLLIDALYQTELLIKKLPEVYHFLFEREGVLHEIDSISKLPYVTEEDQKVLDEQKKKAQAMAAAAAAAATAASAINNASAAAILNSSQGTDQNTTTADESDDATTTDAEKKEEDEDEEEEEKDSDQEDNETKTEDTITTTTAKTTTAVGSDASSSATTGTNSQSSTSPSQQQSHRRLFDRSDLQALLRSRYDLLQQQQQKLHRHHANTINESERGVGRGSTRKYIIQLAQHFITHYSNTQQSTSNTHAAGRSLKEILSFTEAILTPSADDPVSRATFQKLSGYLRDSVMGISSFELMNSGLMKALLAYLTKDEKYFLAGLQDRQQTFQHIFVDTPEMDHDGNNALKKLVVRLQEILSRSEAFEVVTPLESATAANDSLRNPTSMLAKQLRLRLTSASLDVPSMYKQLMVSTHAVATFRVLEEYLLARISTASSSSSHMDDVDEEEQDHDRIEEQHVLIEEEEDSEHEEDQEGKVDKMEIDTENNEDTEMDETINDESAATTSNQAGPSTPVKKEIKKEGEWKIQFSLNGTVISNDSTVYAAVHQYEMNSPTEGQTPRIGVRNIWSSSYPVTYERIWVPSNISTSNKDQAVTKKSTVTSGPIRQLAGVTQPKELQDDSTCYQVLCLLKALSPAITKMPPPLGISAQDFINRKLTAKMNRQLEEPLIVASSCLPTWTFWLMSETPFLFPFETRYLFIQSTSFGYSRLIARWQSLQMRNNTQNGPRNDTDAQQPVLGRMERQKVRIMRHQMLESAIKILDLFGSSPTVLEIEYMGEEGTGMGPTLEFYACTSKEFSKHSLNMWCGSDKSLEGYVVSPCGLFPKSLCKSSSKSTKKIIHLFKTLGQFIAKGLLDFRIIDIPFSPAFFKVALDDVKPTPELLMEIDPVLAKSINMLQSYIKQKRDIFADTSMSSAEKAAAVQNIEVDGAKLQDLCLDFTLPGDESYKLKPSGAEIPVTINNVEEYIELLLDTIAGSGISQQIAAFREGFNCLFAIDDLKLLTYAELVSLFGKADEDWSYATLADTIRADHGFTMESDPVRHLLEILSHMNSTEKRQFLQFTTGSPRLPIGGWKALRPVFTVVRKIPEEPLQADDYLPSVMTCVNYLKMPAYTSKEIMLTRLTTSMKEGQNSFLLS